MTPILIASIIFVAYILGILINFGIPASISNSYYIYEAEHKNLGYLFTAMMVSVGFLIIGPMISMAENEWWQFLGFLCPSGIVFCGVAARFKSCTDHGVHVGGAVIAAIAGLIYCFLSYGEFIPVTISMYVLAICLGCITETIVKCKTFWLEIAGFGSIMIMLLLKVL